MSDTPKTDAIISADTGDSSLIANLANGCRDLERALTQANAEAAAMRGAIKEAMPALETLENQLASSLSSDSRSHDDDRPWRKRVRAVMRLADGSTAGAALLEELTQLRNLKEVAGRMAEDMKRVANNLYGSQEGQWQRLNEAIAAFREWENGATNQNEA